MARCRQSQVSRGGGRAWEVGLRGGGVYYVPIGSSGLFMPVQEPRPPPGNFARRLSHTCPSLEPIPGARGSFPCHPLPPPHHHHHPAPASWCRVRKSPLAGSLLDDPHGALSILPCPSRGTLKPLPSSQSAPVLPSREAKVGAVESLVGAGGPIITRSCSAASPPLSPKGWAASKALHAMKNELKAELEALEVNSA